MVSTVGAQQEGLEFDSTSCLKGMFSHVCMGSLQVLKLPSTSQKHAISGVRLTVDLKFSRVCMEGWPSQKYQKGLKDHR